MGCSPDAQQTLLPQGNPVEEEYEIEEVIIEEETSELSISGPSDNGEVLLSTSHEIEEVALPSKQQNENLHSQSFNNKVSAHKESMEPQLLPSIKPGKQAGEEREEEEDEEEYTEKNRNYSDSDDSSASASTTGSSSDEAAAQQRKKENILHLSNILQTSYEDLDQAGESKVSNNNHELSEESPEIRQSDSGNGPAGESAQELSPKGHNKPKRHVRKPKLTHTKLAQQLLEEPELVGPAQQGSPAEQNLRSSSSGAEPPRQEPRSKDVDINLLLEQARNVLSQSQTNTFSKEREEQIKSKLQQVYLQDDAELLSGFKRDLVGDDFYDDLQ